MNRLRASVGAAPLAHADDIEQFSTEAARVDGEAHVTHKHFRDTDGGNGISNAENEIPWWSLADWGSVRSIVSRGLALEWAEGPGGGHYQNLFGPYVSACCGVPVHNGVGTLSQHYR